MGNAAQEVKKPMTVEEYVQFELQSERRHEYINGQLFEMPGEKDTNTEINYEIGFLLRPLTARGYKIYTNEMKVAIPDGEKYYYPDVFATREAKSDVNRYIKYEPELIVEILSPSTFRTDTIDKYIAYTTIPSLLYYIIVEPETTYVILHAKNAEREWETVTYVRNTDVIPLPLLELSLPLAKCTNKRRNVCSPFCVREKPLPTLIFKVTYPSLLHLQAATGDFVVACMFEKCDTVETDLKELRADVILMDIDMPGTGGIEAYEKQRR